MNQNEVISKRLAEAYYHAELSPDPSNQNGAVIYRDATEGATRMSVGHNQFYRGIIPDVEDRDNKLARIAHAEYDAVVKLSACPIAVNFHTAMYCPWAACRLCAMTIIGSGIKTLVVHRQRQDTYAATRAGQKRSDGSDVLPCWQPDIDEAMQNLKRASVNLVIFDGRVEHYDGEGINLNGRRWCPRRLEFRRLRNTA